MSPYSSSDADAIFARTRRINLPPQRARREPITKIWPAVPPLELMLAARAARAVRRGAVDPKPILDRWVNEAIVYAYALATNPTATTAPEPAAVAPDAQPATPTSTAPRRAARAARAVSIDSRGGTAGRIFVIGSLLALCGGRLMRRVRAKIASASDDE